MLAVYIHCKWKNTEKIREWEPAFAQLSLIGSYINQVISTNLSYFGSYISGFLFSEEKYIYCSLGYLLVFGLFLLV